MVATKLFKYLDVKGGLMMLYYGNLQFTNATRLNDPFDCHPALFNYSNVPTNKYNWPPADFLKQKGKTDMENQRNKYPKIGGECFDSLYLGINIEKEEKEKIIKVAKERNPEIKIYQMTIDPEAFRLKGELI